LFLAHQKPLRTLAQIFPGAIFQIGFWTGGDRRGEAGGGRGLIWESFKNFKKEKP